MKTHPDRVAAESPERATRTRKFQLVNDAYYTLSDASRRREYDAQRRLFTGGRGSSKTYADPFEEAEESDEEVPPGNAGPKNAYSWAWNYFTKGAADPNARQQAENAQFNDVFEEMLNQEGADITGQKKGNMWSILGSLCGAGMGFIVANFAGAIAGAVAGNRLGAIRDSKGKSVYQYFQEDLTQEQKMRVLSQLAAKIFAQAVGSS